MLDHGHRYESISPHSSASSVVEWVTLCVFLKLYLFTSVFSSSFLYLHLPLFLVAVCTPQISDYVTAFFFFHLLSVMFASALVWSYKVGSGDRSLKDFQLQKVWRQQLPSSASDGEMKKVRFYSCFWVPREMMEAPLMWRFHSFNVSPITLSSGCFTSCSLLFVRFPFFHSFPPSAILNRTQKKKTLLWEEFSSSRSQLCCWTDHYRSEVSSSLNLTKFKYGLQSIFAPAAVCVVLAWSNDLHDNHLQNDL